MKKISLFVGLVALLLANLALAAGAVVTSVVGAVQAQTGSAMPRVLRLGDEVGQGETVSTGPSSSVVLKFDDGQVAALTANSRMTLTTYQYNPVAETGNSLLSLIGGGMRAITGVIARRTPQNVAYRAATATIGIRGTDLVIATNGGDVMVSVTEGSVVLTMGALTLIITAPEAVFIRADGTTIRGTLADVLRQVPEAFRSAFSQLLQMEASIQAAGPGIPRGRLPGQFGQQGQQGSGGGGGAASGQ